MTPAPQNSTPELRVTRASQASQASQAGTGSVPPTPTPVAKTCVSKATNPPVFKITNPPKISGGKGKAPAVSATTENSNRVTRKIVPSVLHGIQDYMSVLPQDLVKELKQSIRKGQWEAVAVEFMRKCAWRLRHFSKEELRKIAGNIVPSGPAISVEQATEFLGDIQKDIQSGISMAHESAARWFIHTSVGKEYLDYAKKMKKGKHAVKQVDLTMLEKALEITDMELMGLWTPIVSSAKSSYWKDSTESRSILLAMRKISYEIITRFIGAMKSWNEAETELSFSARQIILQATSSLKSPAFWPDPPGPYPVGAAKWEAMSIVIESPEDSPDFFFFEERFRALHGPGPRFSAQLESIDGGDDTNESPDADLDDIYSDPAVASGTALTTTQPQRVERVSTSTLDTEGYEYGEESYQEVEDNAGDSDCDSQKSILDKYGGYPVTLSTSTRMDVAAAEILDDDMTQALEEFDKSETDYDAAHPWIQIEDGSEYINEGAERFGRMGVVGRAAYDLAALNALNKKYEKVIVECMEKQGLGRNREMMRDIEERRKGSDENEGLYKEVRTGYRQTGKDVSVSKKALLALDAKAMPAYLSTAADRVVEVKKRKVVGEERSGALFGSKPVTKKIRISKDKLEKDIPAKDMPRASGADSEVSSKPTMGATLVNTQDGVEVNAVVLEK